MTQAVTLSFLLDAPSTLLSICKSTTGPWQFYLLNVFLKAGCCSVFLDHCTQLRKASYQAPCLQSLPQHSFPSPCVLPTIHSWTIPLPSLKSFSSFPLLTDLSLQWHISLNSTFNLIFFHLLFQKCPKTQLFQNYLLKLDPTFNISIC